MTEIGHALNIIIMPLFWGLLWPGIAPMGWNRDTWQFMMHMVTLHSVPFISTTINIALTDIKLLRSDVSKVTIAGYAYMVCNIIGQFLYGQPLYAQTEWVAKPLQTLGFCVFSIYFTGLMYKGSTYLIDLYATWLANRSEVEAYPNDDENKN